MKYLIALALCLVISGVSFADTDAYLVETDDGVAITYYVERSNDTPTEALVAAGYGNNQARPLDKADIPNDLEEDRDFWYYNPAKKKIDVDKAKKKLHDDEVVAEEEARDTIIKKLTAAVPNLTEEDLGLIGIGKENKPKKGNASV